MKVSDLQLGIMENNIKQRAQMLETEAGKAECAQWVLNMFEYLRLSGYKLPNDKVKAMAKVYASQLKDAIVIYGYDDVSRCVKEWIKEDTYMRFPNSGQILQKVHELCGNPLAEIARRNEAARVEMMVQKEREELMKDVTEEQLKEMERRYKHE